MINVCDLAGYTPNVFKYEPLHVYGSIDTILSEKLENDWKNPIFHTEPNTPKPSEEYYQQSAVNGELL